jgi:hypothetical protein
MLLMCHSDTKYVLIKQDVEILCTSLSVRAISGTFTHLKWESVSAKK